MVHCTRIHIFAVAALATLLAGPLAAQGKSGKAGKPARGGETVVETSRGSGGSFLDVELRVIRKYYAEHRSDLKPLPPGIAKNLARGKPLPPGIAKQRLHSTVLNQLPPRDGFEISVVGAGIVLLDAHGVVVDLVASLFN